MTSSPTPLNVPEGKYFLLEKWQLRERGPGCEHCAADPDTFGFDPETGELVVATGGQGVRRLGGSDIGYFGCGRRYSGVCTRECN